MATSNGHTGITDRLRKMAIGEIIQVKVSQSRNLFLFANRLGISIATRKRGKIVKVWRLQ